MCVVIRLYYDNKKYINIKNTNIKKDLKTQLKCKTDIRNNKILDYIWYLNHIVVNFSQLDNCRS